MWLTSMSAMGDVVGDVAVHGLKDTRGFGSNRQFHHDPNSIVSPIATSKTFIIYHSARSRPARFTPAGPASAPFWSIAQEFVPARLCGKRSAPASIVAAPV